MDSIKTWIVVGLIALLLLGGLVLKPTEADTSPQRTVVLEGRQVLSFGDIELEKTDEMRALFFLSSKKMYEIGAMNGDFPATGWHIPEEMGGVWAHPMKVLDGFCFEIEDDDGIWLLADCREFSHGFAHADFHFSKSGLEVDRKDFIAEDEAALFSLITIRNTGDEIRTGALRFIGDVDLRPSWYSTLRHGIDALTYRDGKLTGHDAAADGWGVVLGADSPPAGHEIVGARGVLEYPFSLEPGEEEEMRFLVVADQEGGPEGAVAGFESLIGRCDELLAEKIDSYFEEVFGGVRFSCSDPSFQRAYYCAKANLVMLSADVSPYIGEYLFAGVPEYVQLFGCDTAYSVPGLASTGFDDEALGALKNLATVGERQQGRIPHELSTSGNVYNKGNVQETPQFTSACWNYYRWTGDGPFLEEIYPLCKQGIFDYVLALRDRDEDRYPEGAGMVERAGMGPEKLDSTCYLYKAILDLAQMAQALREEEDRASCTNLAAEIRRGFNEDWWIEAESMFADSLGFDDSRKLDSHWIVVVPMEVGIADREKGRRALERIEQEWLNEWGLVHTKALEEAVWTLPTGVLATAAFRYGQLGMGTWLLDRIATTIEHGMLGAFSELIPQGGDSMQLWSAAMFLQGITEGIFGLDPLAHQHRLGLSPTLPEGWEDARLEGIRVGEHTIDVALERDGEDGYSVMIGHQGHAGLEIELSSLAGDELTWLTDEISYTRQPAGDVTKLAFVLEPGQQAQVVFGLSD